MVTYRILEIAVALSDNVGVLNKGELAENYIEKAVTGSGQDGKRGAASV